MENVALRFRLAAELGRMKFGECRIIDRDTAHLAWPPTGDHDRSIEGVFRAMALAAGRHRPETSYTTLERIQNDLDETFKVQWLGRTGEWHISRPVPGCPHCKGSGYVRRLLPSPELEEVTPDGLMTDNLTVDSETIRGNTLDEVRKELNL